jgi:hypothetical protein
MHQAGYSEVSDRAPRSSLFMSVEIIANGTFPATLRNVSASGALLKTDASLQVGDRAMMRRGDELYSFQVARLSYGHVGIAFDSAVDVELFRRPILTGASHSKPAEPYRRPGLVKTKPLSEGQRIQFGTWANASRHGHMGE